MTTQAGFKKYLKAALEMALSDESSGDDKGNLRWMHRRCRRGVRKNWTDLTSEEFLEQYLWCVGSIQKKFTVWEKHFPAAMKLFRQCNARKIIREVTVIRSEWEASKCNLKSRMVEAVLSTA